jgi:hypothetical protein
MAGVAVEAVEAGLLPNPIEFDGMKSGRNPARRPGRAPIGRLVCSTVSISFQALERGNEAFSYSSMRH